MAFRRSLDHSGPAPTVVLIDPTAQQVRHVLGSPPPPPYARDIGGCALLPAGCPEPRVGSLFALHRHGRDVLCWHLLRLRSDAAQDRLPRRSGARRTIRPSRRGIAFMANRSLSLDDRLYDYVLSSSLREPQLLKELRAETAKLPAAGMQIGPEQGQFMALLVELTGTRRALEIGTFTGYSSLVVALAMPPEGR